MSSGLDPCPFSQVEALCPHCHGDAAQPSHAAKAMMQTVPAETHPRLEGVLATLSLKLMLSFIPAVLLKLG